jgi:hypothetical protein
MSTAMLTNQHANHLLQLRIAATEMLSAVIACEDFVHGVVQFKTYSLSFCNIWFV